VAIVFPKRESQSRYGNPAPTAFLGPIQFAGVKPLPALKMVSDGTGLAFIRMV
jgi:hypothetical protein